MVSLREPADAATEIAINPPIVSPILVLVSGPLISGAHIVCQSLLILWDGIRYGLSRRIYSLIHLVLGILRCIYIK